MNIKSVSHVISSLIIMIGITIGSAIPVSVFYGDGLDAVIKLSVSALLPIICGIILFHLTKCRPELGVREGFGIVTFGWVICTIFGSVPYMLIMDMTWFDSFFETMSGFTTTGASVLDNTLLLSDGSILKSGIADLPRGLLYWRSMTHWLGGMGIVVLSLAILPFLGIGGQQLYNAETTGADKNNKLTPRIANSAKILWGVYFLMSVAQTILLWIFGMDFLEAWCHTCGTVATGGFSTEQASVAAFDSIWIEAIITLFMFFAGCNFILHFKVLKGEIGSFFKDEEFKTYLGVTLFSIASITLFTLGENITTSSGEIVSGTLGNCIRYSSFQCVSIITTTGFVTADFDLWPSYCKIVLLCLMFIGGCAGSTGGGMKVSRIILSTKYAFSQTMRCLFPHSLSNVCLNKERVTPGTLHKVVSFFFIFIFIFIITAALISAIENTDIQTAIGASAASVGNVGPGFMKIGPMYTYAWMSPFSKLILSFAMLVGRLEIYTVLIIFIPSFWKR